ncbi:hypothetical protein MHYP_G00203810 [Metynnis hypsauchen]
MMTFPTESPGGDVQQCLEESDFLWQDNFTISDLLRYRSDLHYLHRAVERPAGVSIKQTAQSKAHSLAEASKFRRVKRLCRVMLQLMRSFLKSRGELQGEIRGESCGEIFGDPAGEFPLETLGLSFRWDSLSPPFSSCEPSYGVSLIASLGSAGINPLTASPACLVSAPPPQ